MKMKKKLFIPLIAALLTIGLTSVGFAAWVITGTTNDKADSQFTVYSVENKTVAFTASVAESDEVLFATDGKTYAHKWLVFEETDREDLTVTVTIAISNWNKIKDSAKSFTINISPKNANGAAVTVSDASIEVPAVTVSIPANSTTATVTATKGAVGADSVTIREGSDTATFSVDVKFKWGSDFGGVNPNEFFNSQEATNELRSQAETKLQTLYDIGSLDFDINVAATVTE